jgi:hypothetical protein
MTTNKQPVAPKIGKTATSLGSNEDLGAMIPKARLEVLIAMGRAFPPVVTAMSLSLLGTIGLSGYLVYRDMHSVPQYFTTDSRGRAVEMRALDEPTMTRDQVSQYVVDSLVAAMSMDYKNFKDTQNAASANYTPAAFNEFVKSLTDQGIYEAMEKRRLVLRAVATGAPRVVGEGQPQPDQPYAWVVQAPFVWTFSSAQRDQSFNYVIQAVVTRQPTSERENGVAISAVTITQGGEKL